MRPSSKSVGWNPSCLFLLLLLSGFSAAPQSQPFTDRPVPETLPELLQAIEQIMSREKIPGLMLAIVTKDSVLFSGGLGYSDLATQRKVDGKQRFRLGSTTKMMVAMGILHMVHNNKLALETKLKDLAPEIPFENPWETTHPVKIIHLLEHTSGFSGALMNKSVNLTKTDLKGLDVLKFYEDQLVCRSKPGAMPSYNNTNYTVLGYVIEKMTGEAWPVYLREHVLSPIRMHHTDFELRLPNNGEYAQGYISRGGMQAPVPSAFTLNSNGAHGSMNSCADDMAKLTQFFLNDWRVDTTQWLPKLYLDEMEIVHTTLAARHGLRNGYGLGNHIETWHPKLTLHGHGGSIQGFLAHMVYDRRRGVGMAIAKNGGYNDADIAMLVADYLTRDIPGIIPVEKEIPLDSIQPFLGYYKVANSPQPYSFLENLVNDISVKLNGDQLLLKPFRGWPLPLSHVGDLKFRRSFEHDALMVFGQDEDGNSILMGAAPGAGSHRIRTSFASILIKRSLAALGLLALFLGVTLGALSMVLRVLKKISTKQFPLTIFPMLAAFSLGIGLWPLIQVEPNYLSFTGPNTVTLTIFFGTLFFGIFSALGLWFLYSRWRLLKSRWMKILVAFTTVGTAAVAGIFLGHGMVGAMVWKW